MGSIPNAGELATSPSIIMECTCARTGRFSCRHRRRRRLRRSFVTRSLSTNLMAGSTRCHVVQGIVQELRR